MTGSFPAADHPRCLASASSDILTNTPFGVTPFWDRTRSRLDFDSEQPAVPDPREDLLALDEALNKLTVVNPGAAELVQVRYFTGLALPDAARILAISPRTAGRLWAYARAWLRREIEGS